jgi:glutathione synthase/RimK-type ligase-like ATP-grasp enzyme
MSDYYIMTDYYEKYVKYKTKYLSIKEKLNQLGGGTKTFYVDVNEDEFQNTMVKILKEKGYTERKKFPVDFIFLSGDSAFFRNKFDTKKSKWFNNLYGKSKLEITNKIALHKKFGDEDFFIKAIYLNSDEPIPDFDESNIKILKPLNGYQGMGIRIVKTKKEVEEWIKENPKYKNWILEDYLIDPDLKDGYKFHFRVYVLVKITQSKKVEVYISDIKFFRKALEKYKKEDFLNKDIHDTHYNPKWKPTIFPEELPDGWTDNDAQKNIKKMNEIIKKIFTGQNQFIPEWNAKNGFELFGCDFIFSNKKVYLLEINAKASFKGCSLIIPGLIENILENKNGRFTRLI